MIRPIMTARFFLTQPSEQAGPSDMDVVHDLVNTLEAHRANCVGLAANMIGVRKRIIAVIDEDGSILVMLNPEVVSSRDAYTTEEGCLSLPGTRKTTRYRRISVSYDDTQLQHRQARFAGRVAQAIQHEIDHCNGVLI